MGKRRFYIVDVFAEKKYAGNQLAVFRHGSQYSDTGMQEIAKEMNYSETTFILSDDQTDGGYDVRIFTPDIELPFAGHPTLGTAYVIQREIIGDTVDKVNLNLKVGQIPVTFQYSGNEPTDLWMKQVAPVASQTFSAEATAEVLGLATADIDERFPIQAISTGISFIIVPLRSLDALKRAGTVKEKLLKLVENSEAKAILVFSPEPYTEDANLSVRVFADFYGVPEDPATGSANGCLAGYLVKHRYFGTDKIDVRSQQGYEIGRPSLLCLKAEASQEEIDVYVGGKSVMVAIGELV